MKQKSKWFKFVRFHKKHFLILVIILGAMVGGVVAVNSVYPIYVAPKAGSGSCVGAGYCSDFTPYGSAQCNRQPGCTWSYGYTPPSVCGSSTTCDGSYTPRCTSTGKYKKCVNGCVVAYDCGFGCQTLGGQAYCFKCDPNQGERCLDNKTIQTCRASDSGPGFVNWKTRITCVSTVCKKNADGKYGCY